AGLEVTPAAVIGHPEVGVARADRLDDVRRGRVQALGVEGEVAQPPGLRGGHDLRAAFADRAGGQERSGGRAGSDVVQSSSVRPLATVRSWGSGPALKYPAAFLASISTLASAGISSSGIG